MDKVVADLDSICGEQQVDNVLLHLRHGLMQETHAILQGMLQRAVLYLGQGRLQIQGRRLHISSADKGANY